METPKQYAQKKLLEWNNNKTMTRISINNMLVDCFLQSDKDFYLSALKELDLLCLFVKN